MADADSKGGTPIFASPECFEKKDKKSDIFSFGRVILFLLLTKNQFIKWLFVPIKDQLRAISLHNLCAVESNSPLYMVSRMTSLSNRISLQDARNLFNRLRKNSNVKLKSDQVLAIRLIIENEISISRFIETYTSELCDFR